MFAFASLLYNNVRGGEMLFEYKNRGVIANKNIIFDSRIGKIPN
jgi:hypothetical protein